ncbi:aspartyl protease family protein [Actinomadura rubrisoli]|uniref:Tetratricopeptide repeat protein n=1 Tax=Actinomadura rubrisoli TaxID=2530368 RepID=A0A4R5B8N2_9ACTN|nr:aspartyl protease family protein [Actinomadura rubrisoli]TDD80064.1 tetratricopeptide repeat protein [Actinomadura rubrisoli]
MTFARSGDDPEELFKNGRFEDADRGYAKILEKDPDNARAHAQRGYIALLSNRFADAEKFLTKAVALAPDDRFSKEKLADVFVRQDQLARAVPLLRAAGIESYAKQYESVTGTPYEIRGPQSTRLPIDFRYPIPLADVSVNGAEPVPFTIDTGAPLAFSMETAEKAGVRAVATSRGRNGQEFFTLYHGVVDSFRMGDIEMRNVPVVWSDGEMPHPLGVPQPKGAFGTTLFYRFLTTIDFPNNALVLRRKTRAQLRRLRAEARRAGADRLPLWLAYTHFPCTLGSLNGHGPRVVSLDFGVEGATQVSTTQKMAEQAGVRLDLDRPASFDGQQTSYPFIAPKAGLGRAVARNVYGVANEGSLLDGPFRFDTLGNFSQEFFKAFTAAFDYLDMNLYVSSR